MEKWKGPEFGGSGTRGWGSEEKGHNLWAGKKQLLSARGVDKAVDENGAVNGLDSHELN